MYKQKKKALIELAVVLNNNNFAGSHTRPDELRHRKSNWFVTGQYWSYTCKFYH